MNDLLSCPNQKANSNSMDFVAEAIVYDRVYINQITSSIPSHIDRECERRKTLYAECVFGIE